MGKKYKYILFAWCASMSFIMGVVGASGFVYYPDLKYEIAGVVYVMYAIIVLIGIRRISSKSMREEGG